MKKILIPITFIASLLIVGCDSSSFDSLNTTVEDTTKENTTIDNISSDKDTTTIEDTTTEEDTTSEDDSETVERTYPIIGGERLPLPQNKDSYIALPSDIKESTMTSFMDYMPEGYRAIHGNNFVKGDYYASGQLKFSCDTKARQGFQTPFFNTNKKLELRLCLGSFFNNTKGNNIDDELPVLAVYAMKSSGEIISTTTVMTLNKGNEDHDYKIYMSGIDVAYLELRVVQHPYKGQQAYNFGLKGIHIVGYPYDYK